MREKFQRKQIVNDFKIEYNTKGYNLCINNSTFVSPIYTFSLAGNIIAYTPIRGTNSEDYFNHIIYKRKKIRLWREINSSPSISYFRDRVFSIFRRKKVRVRSVGSGQQSDYSRADTINKNIKKTSKIFPYREKVLEYTEKII